MIDIQRGGPEALADRPSRPDRIWNRIPEAIRCQIVDLALDQPGTQPAGTGGALHGRGENTLSQRLRFIGFKSARSHHEPSPYIVIKAAEYFKEKTTSHKQLRQTVFTYHKITELGLVLSLSLCSDGRLLALHCSPGSSARRRQAQDVTATLDLALAASGLDQMNVVHRATALVGQRRLVICAERSGRLAGQAEDRACPRSALPSADPRQNRALASNAQEPNPA